MYKTSAFPEVIQYFTEKRDIAFWDKNDLSRYQTLTLQEILTPLEREELNTLTQKLINVLISAFDFNVLTDTMVAIQIAIKNKTTEIDLLWNELEGEISDTLNTMQSTWEAWLATIKIDLQLYTTFDFENLASLGSTERTTVFTSDTQIDETIKIKNSSIIVATRKTIFEDNGDITTTETVYKDGSIVIRQSTIVTTFNEDGSITEAVSI